MTNFKSKCCKASVTAQCADEGTCHYTCDACKKPCSWESDFDRFMEKCLECQHEEPETNGHSQACSKYEKTEIKLGQDYKTSSLKEILPHHDCPHRDGDASESYVCECFKEGYEKGMIREAIGCHAHCEMAVREERKRIEKIIMPVAARIPKEILAKIINE